MYRDKKRTRTRRRVEESDDELSTLGPALNSARNSVRSSRKSSRTNSATASRSSSRIRGLGVVNYYEQSDDEDGYDDDYGNAEEMTEEECQKLIKEVLAISSKECEAQRVE